MEYVGTILDAYLKEDIDLVRWLSEGWQNCLNRYHKTSSVTDILENQNSYHFKDEENIHVSTTVQNSERTRPH